MVVEELQDSPRQLNGDYEDEHNPNLLQYSERHGYSAAALDADQNQTGAQGRHCKALQGATDRGRLADSTRVDKERVGRMRRAMALAGADWPLSAAPRRPALHSHPFPSLRPSHRIPSPLSLLRFKYKARRCRSGQSYFASEIQSNLLTI